MEEAGEIVVMFLLSTWKVYIAFGYFAYESYSFLAAGSIVITAVVFSNFLCYLFSSRMQNSVWFKKFKISKTYLKGAKFYSKYGFYPSAILAPIILGVPTFCLVSFAFEVSNKKVISALIVSSLLWGIVINIAFHYSIALF